MSKPLLLLVDDSKEMGFIVVCLGKRAGWEVVVCVDAEAAWDALAQRQPDLVLLDVNLPGASGAAVAAPRPSRAEVRGAARRPLYPLGSGRRCGRRPGGWGRFRVRQRPRGPASGLAEAFEGNSNDALERPMPMQCHRRLVSAGCFAYNGGQRQSPVDRQSDRRLQSRPTAHLTSVCIARDNTGGASAGS